MAEVRDWTLPGPDPERVLNDSVVAWEGIWQARLPRVGDKVLLALGELQREAIIESIDADGTMHLRGVEAVTDR